ncbi:MAG: S41 family peptidase [Magnetospiraceae bacterium]
MKLNRFKTIVVVFLGIAIGVGGNHLLTGCADSQGTIQDIATSFSHLQADLDAEQVAKMDRFATEYQSTAGRSQKSKGELETFEEVYAQVLHGYVLDVNDDKLIDEALMGLREASLEGGKDAHDLMEASLDTMVRSLDPHSDYLNPTEAKEMTARTRGEFGGLGVEVTGDPLGVKVVAPIEDTPAFRAGLKTGDIITHTDGESMKGWSLHQAVSKLRGRPGRPVDLRIAREEKTLNIRVVRDIITVRAVRWRTEGDIGYIRIVSFNELVEDGLQKAFRDIRKSLGGNLKGYVLDLRGNPGGLLDQAVAVADAFLNRGDIVTIRSRSRFPGERVYSAHRGDEANGLPLVVLINGSSASGSEIVAGTLQDLHRAVVLGTQSFGKGSVQTLLPLRNDGFLRLTTALYYTAADRVIQGVGVVPDIVIPLGTEPAKDEEGSREALLPNALKAKAKKDPVVAQATINKDRCVPVGEGEEEDHQLGCALALLQAGSAGKFLATLSDASTDMPATVQ